MEPVHGRVEVGSTHAADPLAAAEGRTPSMWCEVQDEGRRRLRGAMLAAPGRDHRLEVQDAWRRLDGRSNRRRPSSVA